MTVLRIEEIAAFGSVQILPGEAFWTRTLELPPNLSVDEIAEAAELTIDSASPVPAERRVHGFYPLNPDRSSCLLYAASHSRLDHLGSPIDPDADAVLPAFLPAVVLATAIGSDGYLDAISIGGFVLRVADQRIDVLTLPPAWDSDTREVLLAAENLPVPPDAAVAVRLSVSVDPDGSWTLGADSPDPGAPVFPSVVIPSDNQPYADLRGPEAIAAIRRTARNRRRLGQATRGLAAALVVTGIFQILLYPFNGYIERRREALAAVTREVEAMDTRRELVLRLEKLAEGSSPPLEWLAIANRTRPDSIEWDEALVTAEGMITIEGRAPDIATVNNYAAQLRTNPAFTEVTNEATAREGRIAFELRLRFNP